MSISVGPGIPNPAPATLADALHHFSRDAATSGIPVAYIQALRYGTPGDRHTVTIAGCAVTITLATTPARPAPARERDSWIELRDTITAVNTAGVDTVTTALPREIAAAAWERNGATIRARRPRTRRKLRLSALSPLPLLAELLPTSTAASSAAAVSIALTPLPPAVLHQQPPPNGPVTITSGDIARPEPRHLLGFLTPPLAPGSLPASSAEEAAPDTAPPAPPDPQPLLPSAPVTDTPPTKLPASPEPSPSPSPETEATAPPVEPEPTGTPTPDTDPTPNAAPTTSHQPRKRRHWHAHHRHGHRHR